MNFKLRGKSTRTLSLHYISFILIFIFRNLISRVLVFFLLTFLLSRLKTKYLHFCSSVRQIEKHLGTLHVLVETQTHTQQDWYACDRKYNHIINGMKRINE